MSKTKAAELEKRLRALGRPAGPMLGRLFCQGLMTAHLARLALAAAEVATRPRDIVPFIVAYHALRARQVPVKRIFALAGEFNRRIDLLAQADEWRATHEWLCLAKRLQKERDLKNEGEHVFDVQAHEALLPARWPGYLIRTTRRLAMVRLRMHLTTDAWIYRATRKDRALAVVFLNRQRFIVWLRVDDTGEAPALRIQRITAHNERSATKDEREAVYERLELTPRSHAHPWAPSHAVDPTIEPVYLTGLRRLLPVLREHKVERVRMSDTADWSDRENQGLFIRTAAGEERGSPIARVTVARDAEQYTSVDDGWTVRRVTEKESLQSALRYVAQRYEEDIDKDVDVNWRCHRNGRREMVIDVPQGTLTLTVRTKLRGPPAFHRHMDIETGQEAEPASTDLA